MTDLMGRGPLGQKGQSKPKKASKPIRKVSEKKAAYRASAEGKSGLEYIGKVKQLPCVICEAPAPSDAHHCFHGRYGSRKVDDFSVIPLCKACHQDGPNAIHRGKQSWLMRNGPDYGYIEQTRELVKKLFD